MSASFSKRSASIFICSLETGASLTDVDIGTGTGTGTTDVTVGVTVDVIPTGVDGGKFVVTVCGPGTVV